MLQLEIVGIDQNLGMAPDAPIRWQNPENRKKMGASYTCGNVITLCRRLRPRLPASLMPTALKRFVCYLFGVERNGSQY
jgi:hypothetical protein